MSRDISYVLHSGGEMLHRMIMRRTEPYLSLHCSPGLLCLVDCVSSTVEVLNALAVNLFLHVPLFD